MTEERSSFPAIASENTGQAADLADPDLDGLANVLERAFGSNPLEPSPLPMQTYANRREFFLEYPLHRQAVSDVDVSVEWSADGSSGSWSSTGLKTTLMGESGPMQRLWASLLIKGPQAFFRVIAKAREIR
jgi:hypothetical protein